MLAHPSFDLDWNLVRTFVAVAKSGSLAGGARVLGISHPTAARHIQVLEETLGVTLFTRGAKGLELNGVGGALVNSADQMHASAIALQARIEEIKSAPLDRVRIGIAELLAEMVPALLTAELDGDGASVDLLVSNDLVNLLNRDADLAVRHVRPRQQELVCKRIGTLGLGAFASRGYAEQHGCVSAESLFGHRFIEGLAKDYLTRGAAQRGMHIKAEQIAVRTDSVACQRAALEAGCGIAVLPLWMAEGRDWVSVFPKDMVIDLEVWLVARPGLRDNQALRRLFTDLGDSLGEKLNAVELALG